MKRLFLIRGLPGSGKTTMAKMLTKYAVAADNFMVNALGEYEFNADKLGACHGACADVVAAWMGIGEAMIAVHNTFTQEWEAKPYFEMAKLHGYEMFVISCENDFGNDHGVPPESIDRMRSRWESLR